MMIFSTFFSPQHREKRIIIFIVSLALFMDALDTTIINTAIPAMSHSLHVHPVDLKIALISYLISLAIFIPISGWIGDKYGIKRVFMLALAIFTVSSLWCGYAQTLFELVIARSCQGLGGSLMLPLGRLIILRTFQRHELVEAMNAVVMVVSIGLMLGPLAGGFITDHLSWHWIFWVNIPVGILAIAMAWHWMNDTPPQKVRPFDFLGFILFGGGLAALTFSLSDLSESTANSTIAFGIMGIAILMLVCYFLHSYKQPHPVINMTLFRLRTFQISIVGNLIARLGFGGVPFLLPLLLQIGLGYSAQLSGLLLVPIAFGILLVKSISLRILRFVGYKRLLLINTILVGFSLWTLCLVNMHTSVYLIAVFTFIFGFLISLQYSGMNSLAYADIATEDLSAATSLVSTMQQLAQSFGVAASALLLTYFSYSPTVIGKHLALTPTIFHQTFLAMGIFTIFSTLIFTRLKVNDGHQMLTVPAQEKIATH
ncbi:MAG TPA: DHA2 family efflux MFS transporter permease subunit [Gammaproteobacteria bacterium]|jgi:EmrB/QacA subfamily drug resistance transporter|nr:DHA2 family efflux MFS transporter permease subunit [Gammaproteobacteria bacterium]